MNTELLGNMVYMLKMYSNSYPEITDKISFFFVIHKSVNGHPISL